MIKIRFVRTRVIKISFLMLVVMLIFILSIKPYEEEVKVKYIETIEEFQLEDDWMMITNSQQIKNLKIDQEIDTELDFENNFVIVSKHKIRKLSYNKLRDDCNCGLPVGKMEFDKDRSDEGKIYIYLSEKTWLAQAI